MKFTEFLAVDHEKLLAYVGKSAFSAIGKNYATCGTSLPFDTRWFSHNLSKFLGETIPYCKNPELAELATLEAARNAANEAPEARIFTPAELAAVEAAGHDRLFIDMHPSARRLTFQTNAASIWSALQCEQFPPRPERLESPVELLVWRQNSSPRFRILGQEEAAAFDMAQAGSPTRDLKNVMAKPHICQTAEQCVAAYLRGWVESELVSDVRKRNDCGEK